MLRCGGVVMLPMEASKIDKDRVTPSTVLPAPQLAFLVGTTSDKSYYRYVPGKGERVHLLKEVVRLFAIVA